MRYLKILKARGTEIRWPQLAFTLKSSFKVFRSLIMEGPPELIKKLVSYSKEYYSSSIRSLDEIIGAIFRRRCYNLLEKDVTLAPEHLFRVTVLNVLNQGGHVIILPPQGLSATTVWKSLEPFAY